MEWMTDNMGTIVVSVILLVVVFFVIRKMWRDRKNGKRSCGGECGGCIWADSCHRPNKK